MPVLATAGPVPRVGNLSVGHNLVAGGLVELVSVVGVLPRLQLVAVDVGHLVKVLPLNPTNVRMDLTSAEKLRMCYMRFLSLKLKCMCFYTFVVQNEDLDVILKLIEL